MTPIPPHRPEVRAYTPGPWFQHSTNGVWADPVRRIAIVENERDARLIASAPALYEALREVLVYMEHPEGEAPNGLRLAQAVPVEVRGGDAESLHRAERDGVPGDDGADLTEMGVRS